MACLIFKVSQTCYRYKARLDEENQQIAEWLIQLTNDHMGLQALFPVFA